MRAALTTDSDVIISEIGGTVGDIESLPFLEAIRQMRREVGPENVMYIHCTLVPPPRGLGALRSTARLPHGRRLFRARGDDGTARDATAP